MKRLCIINAVGLTRPLLEHAPNLKALGEARPWQPPIPAVTCTAQATLLTGKPPREHGIVANGWLHPTGEVRFWQQDFRLLQAPSFTEGLNAVSLFWWFPMAAPLKGYATPRPHYGADGSKTFGILDMTGCGLEKALGPFPFSAFWGPMAGLKSSQWIARSAAHVMTTRRPQLTMVYLPHLDYDFQRYGPGNSERVREVDACAAEIIAAAKNTDTQVIALSEYGLTPVTRPVYLNRVLREHGFLRVRQGPFGEQFITDVEGAFAICDHQVAHIHCRGVDKHKVRDALLAAPGVDSVVEPRELSLDHPRSGDWIALAKRDSWCAYPFWLEEAKAPDYARTVDIHRKPGYDPCELFMTSNARALYKVGLKKLGLRALVDVIPLDASLVKGSHGLAPLPGEEPVVIAENPPASMEVFGEWVRRRLG